MRVAILIVGALCLIFMFIGAEIERHQESHLKVVINKKMWDEAQKQAKVADFYTGGFTKAEIVQTLSKSLPQPVINESTYLFDCPDKFHYQLLHAVGKFVEKEGELYIGVCLPEPEKPQ